MPVGGLTPRSEETILATTRLAHSLSISTRDLHPERCTRRRRKAQQRNFASRGFRFCLLQQLSSGSSCSSIRAVRAESSERGKGLFRRDRRSPFLLGTAPRTMPDCLSHASPRVHRPETRRQDSRDGGLREMPTKVFYARQLLR